MKSVEIAMDSGLDYWTGRAVRLDWTTGMDYGIAHARYISSSRVAGEGLQQEAEYPEQSSRLVGLETILFC